MVSNDSKNINEPKQATPLYIHTLETLCKELISGRGLIIDEQDNEFRLSSSESRTILNWYWNNRSKWAQRNRKEDVEAIADQLEIEPPVFPIAKIAEEGQETRRIYLKTMRVHRFAGIHQYGTPEKPPEDFEFDFDKGLTLIEGQNGAGKTSLLNAVCWCFTGHVYRSQRPPEEVDAAVSIRIQGEAQITSEDETAYDITAITPIPSAEVLKAIGDDNPVPLDTNVELFFVDFEGNEVGSIKRSVERGQRGNIRITEPSFSVLGLDPIAREVGTKMPGLIPYIQLGTACEVGKAVASLTGIKPLEDLTTHAEKSQTKLKTDLVKERKAEINTLDSSFSETCVELADLIKNNPNIDPKIELPIPTEKNVADKLATLTKHFEKLQGQALAKSRSILGKSFDYNDRTARQDLIENIGPAIGLLDRGNLSRLSSAIRLSNLKNLTDVELSQAESIINCLLYEANELTNLTKDANTAARVRLYARIANWIKEHENKPYVIDDCPVCESELKGKVDPVTGKAIQEHIREYLEKAKESDPFLYTEKSDAIIKKIEG